MHIPRKPGEQVEVDWAGDPTQIIDPDTGESTYAYVFVGVLSFSQYTYAEAFLNEKQNAWFTAHVHMLEFNLPGPCKKLLTEPWKIVLTESWKILIID